MARGADEEYYDAPAGSDGVGGIVQEQLKKTPWWMISIAVHAVLLMIGYFVAYSVPAKRPPVDVAMDVAPEQEEEFEEEIKEEEEELDKDIKTDEPPIEDPVIRVRAVPG
ncbi:MAG: hypothetical protein ACYTGX_08905 [Planctomycetota bacterium]|jgi:hypothetical protein